MIFHECILVSRKMHGPWNGQGGKITVKHEVKCQWYYTVSISCWLRNSKSHPHLQRFTMTPTFTPHTVAEVVENFQTLLMNSMMKLVIPLHSLYWSIHTKDESKRGTMFAFIFGVNWLWRCGVTASFAIFFHEIKC